MLSVRQWHRDCPTVVAFPEPHPALLPHRGLITRVTTFLFPALDCSSLRLCRAEAFVALGQYPQALEDLDAVCRAEPGEHQVSEGHIDWSQLLLYRSSFPLLNSPSQWSNPAQKCTWQTHFRLLTQAVGAVLLSQERSGTVSFLSCFSSSP